MIIVIIFIMMIISIKRNEIFFPVCPHFTRLNHFLKTFIFLFCFFNLSLLKGNATQTISDTTTDPTLMYSLMSASFTHSYGGS